MVVFSVVFLLSFRSEVGSSMEIALNNYPEDLMERQLVALNVNEKVTILEGNPMQKDSEFLELFSHYLVKMQESGLVNRLKDMWVNKGEERQYGFGNPIPLGYENVLFPFGIVAISLLVVLIIAVAELGHKSYANTKPARA